MMPETRHCLMKAPNYFSPEESTASVWFLSPIFPSSLGNLIRLFRVIPLVPLVALASQCGLWHFLPLFFYPPCPHCGNLPFAVCAFLFVLKWVNRENEEVIKKIGKNTVLCFSFVNRCVTFFMPFASKKKRGRRSFGPSWEHMKHHVIRTNFIIITL